MRFAVLYPLAVLLGTSAGLGLTWYEFSSVDNHFNTRELLSATVFQPLPKVVVEGSDQYDFGSLQHQQSGEHVFVVRNEGSALLGTHAAKSTVADNAWKRVSNMPRCSLVRVSKSR